MKRKDGKFSRRSFVRNVGGAAALGVMPCSAFGGLGWESPNNALNVAGIGVGGMGGADINNVGKQKNVNVVALCDVDKVRCEVNRKRFKDAKFFSDFRVMLEKMEKEIDAVTVGTPDHTHAVALIEAMKRGKHAYCEKPLARSVHEIRRIREVAAENKVVTQMGNQGHSFDDTYRFVDMINDGAIGKVTEIHAGCGLERDMYHAIGLLPKVKEKHEVPSSLDWDLWLGPAPERSYNPMYLPAQWRGWTPFGTGLIGDWVCHVVDPSYFALGLDAPATIRAEDLGDFDPAIHTDVFPYQEKITFEFPAKGKRGPVKLVWFGGRTKLPRPPEMGERGKEPKIGEIVRGEKGIIIHGSHGGKSPMIFPNELREDYIEPEPTIPRVEGGNHQLEFVNAIREGRPACSSFDYGGPLSEIALLGAIALRFPGKKLEWDAEKMCFPNCKEADPLLSPPMRKGWSLE